MRLRARISGRVQGVGFRYFTLRAARLHGVVGWVRNERDGSVLCEAQGDSPALDEFLATVRRGSEFSRVDEVVTQAVDEEPSASLEFQIR